MFILKNAWKNITRNKGRNILIGIIIIVISAATSVTLAIMNSSNTLINSYKNSTDTTATITVNRESMRDMMKPKEDEDDSSSNKEEMVDIFKEISNISVEDIESYGKSKYVKSYYYSLSVGVNSEDLEKVTSSTNDDKGMQGPGGKEDFKASNMNSSDFTLIGYSSYSAMNDFINGNYNITSGKMFTDFSGNYAVINSELAQANDLEVGDTITLEDPNDSDNTIELEITGIYEEVKTTEDNAMSMFTNSANQIITNATVISKLKEADDDLNVTTTPTFILTSSKVIDKFSAELTEKGLSEYLTVSTNLEEVENSTSTISNVRTFATTFLIITLIIGAIVLFIINMINIRERKYEIGVLRTIGMKKSLLSLQFISELLFTTIIGLIVGAIIGSAISMPVSNQLLKNEISSSEQQMENINANFGHDDSNKSEAKMDFKPNGVTTVQAFDSIDAAVDITVLVELLGIGVLLTLVSASASMISIQRFQPLQILKERS